MLLEMLGQFSGTHQQSSISFENYLRKGSVGTLVFDIAITSTGCRTECELIRFETIVVTRMDTLKSGWTHYVYYTRIA